MRRFALPMIAAAALLIAPSAALADPQPVNPSFDTDVSGWYSTGGTVTRDTVTYQSAPASGRWTPGTLFYGLFTEPFAVGVTYIVDFSFRSVFPGGGSGIAMADTRFGTSTGLILADSSRWKHARLAFTERFPGFHYLGFSNLRAGDGGAPSGLLVDDVVLTEQIG